MHESESDSVIKKISKISIQMEKLKNNFKENEDNIELNKLEESGNELKDKKIYKLFNNNIQESKQIYGKFEVYFYFSIREKEFIFPITSDSFNTSTHHIYDLIKNIVKIINEKNIVVNYNNVEYIISLKDIDSEESDNENDMDFYNKNYELKPCKKKNCFPKLDFPSFSSNSLLNNINNKKISFMCKNPLNLMVREKL